MQEKKKFSTMKITMKMIKIYLLQFEINRSWIERRIWLEKNVIISDTYQILDISCVLRKLLICVVNELLNIKIKSTSYWTEKWNYFLYFNQLTLENFIYSQIYLIQIFFFQYFTFLFTTKINNKMNIDIRKKNKTYDKKPMNI